MSSSVHYETYESLRVSLICEDCREDPANIENDLSTGDVICKSCGRVIADHLLDESAEWRNHSNDNDGPVEDKSRVGKAASSLLFGGQLETTMASGGCGLTRAHKDATYEKMNAHLLSVYGQIDTLCSSISVTNAVSENAKQVYKNAVDKSYWKIVTNTKTSRSQQTELAHIGTCLVVACRAEGVSRSVKEISKLVGVEFKQLGVELRGYQKAESKHYVEHGTGGGNSKDSDTISNTSNMDVETSIHPLASVTSVGTGQAEEMIPRLASRLTPPLPFVTTRKAQDIAAEINRRGIAGGRRPATVAGVCLHFATKDLEGGPSLNEISSVVGITEKAIQKVSKILKPLLKTEDEKVVMEE